MPDFTPTGYADSASTLLATAQTALDFAEVQAVALTAIALHLTPAPTLSVGPRTGRTAVEADLAARMAQAMLTVDENTRHDLEWIDFAYAALDAVQDQVAAFAELHADPQTETRKPTGLARLAAGDPLAGVELPLAVAVHPAEWVVVDDQGREDFISATDEGRYGVIGGNVFDTMQEAVAAIVDRWSRS